MNPRHDDTRTPRHATLLTCGLFVMVGMLLAREFFPDSPFVWAVLVAGGIALIVIIPAYIRALFRGGDSTD